MCEAWKFVGIGDTSEDRVSRTSRHREGLSLSVCLSSEALKFPLLNGRGRCVLSVITLVPQRTNGAGRIRSSTLPREKENKPRREYRSRAGLILATRPPPSRSSALPAASPAPRQRRGGVFMLRRMTKTEINHQVLTLQLLRRGPPRRPTLARSGRVGYGLVSRS